jgi:hypothetical protein
MNLNVEQSVYIGGVSLLRKYLLIDSPIVWPIWEWLFIIDLLLGHGMIHGHMYVSFQALFWKEIRGYLVLKFSNYLCQTSFFRGY